MYIIGTYMDRNGLAWPSQQSIARGIRASVKTVQRHIVDAQRMGWLHIAIAGRGGKGWRHYSYQASVPDSVPLEELDESISDHIMADFGGIPDRDAGDTIVSPPSPARAPTTTEIHLRGDNGARNVATSDVDGGDTGSPKVATQLCRTNSRSETPASRTHAEEEAHNAQSRVMRALSENGLGTKTGIETKTRKLVASAEDQLAGLKRRFAEKNPQATPAEIEEAFSPKEVRHARGIAS